MQRKIELTIKHKEKGVNDDVEDLMEGKSLNLRNLRRKGFFVKRTI